MKVLYIALIALLLVSCGPSAEQMTATADAAQAQTQTAAPTFTPTATLTPTPTLTLTPTLTPTETPSPTSEPQTSAGGLPGESIADAILQKDVLNYVQIFESALGCNDSKVTNTIIVEPYSEGNWSEQWIVDRCGAEGSYLIKFISDSTGGAFFSVHKEK